jgi:hypothetical protein
MEQPHIAPERFFGFITEVPGIPFHHPLHGKGMLEVKGVLIIHT